MLIILPARELRRLDALYLRLHRAAIDLRRREPLARHVHLPKLPEALTVSIVAEVAHELLDAAVCLAPGPHDLVTTGGATVAVKGTSAGWISITRTDRTATLLVLVDYADRLSGAGPATIFLYDAAIIAVAPSRLTRSELDARGSPLRWTTWPAMPNVQSVAGVKNRDERA